MTILTNFKEYTPEDENSQVLAQELKVMFIKSAEGADWYQSQSLFREDYLKVLFDAKTGVIVGTGTDVTTLWPLGYSVADVEYDLKATPDTLKGKVFNLRTGKIVDRVYSKAEQRVIAESEISSLQREVAALMVPLQAGKELNMLTEEEAAYLIELQRYTLYLSRVPSQEGYPTNIEWPVLPTK